MKKRIKCVISWIMASMGLLFAPPPWTHNAGEIGTVLQSNGDVSSISWPSNGFNQLFDATLLIGHSGSVTGGHAAGNNSTAQFIEPASQSTEESHVFFNSSVGATSFSSELTTFTYNSTYGNRRNAADYKYVIRNNGTTTINALYVGQYFDFDLASSTSNHFDYDASRGMYYQQNAISNTFLGVRVVSGAIHSAHYRRFGDAFNRTYDSIADGIQDTSAAAANNDTFDITFTLSQRFLNVAPGASVTFTISVFFGSSLAEIQAVSDIAFQSHSGAIGGGSTSTSSSLPPPAAAFVTLDNTTSNGKSPPAPEYDVGGGCFIDLPRRLQPVRE